MREIREVDLLPLGESAIVPEGGLHSEAVGVQMIDLWHRSRARTMIVVHSPSRHALDGALDRVGREEERPGRDASKQQAAEETATSPEAWGMHG